MKKIIIGIVCLISSINLHAKTYPCSNCDTAGVIFENTICETCNGKGYTGWTGTIYYSQPIKCVRCGKGKVQYVQFRNVKYPIGTGTIQTKRKCETCNGKKWITKKDNDDTSKVLSFTKEQWQKIIKIVEINGSINLNKSKVTIKITDHEGF